MKYLRKFATQSDYDAYVESGMETPNVSLVAENYTTFFTKKEKEEPEVLTYEFNIPMVEDYDSLYGETYYSGVINAEFGDIYNKIDALAKAFGEDLGYQWYLDNDKTLEKTNISVNGYRITYIESNTDGRIVLGIGGVFVLGGDAQAYLITTAISVDLPAAWNPNAPKPESDVIEYHFEIPMEEQTEEWGAKYLEGAKESDFSDVYNKIVRFAEEKGEEYDDSYGTYFYVSQELASQFVDISVNGDKITDLEYHSNLAEIRCITDGPINGAWGEYSIFTLTNTRAHYTCGI